MAKKSSKKTRKKAASSSKKTTRKKAPAPKKSSKKTTSRKKTATTKTSAKKATSQSRAKPSPSKSKSKASKEPTTKDVAPKDAGSKDVDTKPDKPKSSSKSSKSSKTSKSSKAKGASSAKASQNGDSTVKSSGPRFRSHFAGDRDTSRAAAAKLAQAAGLSSIRASVAASQDMKKKYRRITKSPLPQDQLDEFRMILLEKRSQLVGDVTSMENEALGGGDGGSLSHLPQHMADQGSDTFEQSLNLDLAASQRGLLKEIDDALGRIAANTYGICELLGKPIKIERLRNTPWARFSIEAARHLEMNPHLAESIGD